MNIFLWILQFLLAAHTIIGAIWKFSNPVETLPSMAAMPAQLWLILSFFEFICAAALILPIFKKSLGKIISYGALGIAAEMFLFTWFHKASGSDDHGQIVYWMIVAAICVFIAIARMKLKPVRS